MDLANAMSLFILSKNIVRNTNSGKSKGKLNDCTMNNTCEESERARDIDRMSVAHYEVLRCFMESLRWSGKLCGCIGRSKEGGRR